MRIKVLDQPWRFLGAICGDALHIGLRDGFLGASLVRTAMPDASVDPWMMRLRAHCGD